MPTYEYRCAACGHQFEQFHAMSADPVKTCPECGKRKVERLFSGGAGVHVKGGSGGGADLPCGRGAPCCGQDTPCMNRRCDV